MAKSLINVRLDPDDVLLARKLRARGISISDVVRRALRAEARKLDAEPVDVDSVLADMMRLYPTPPDFEEPALPDTRDRRAVREHIRAKLKVRR